MLEESYESISKAKEDKVAEEPIALYHQSPTIQLDTTYTELAWSFTGSSFFTLTILKIKNNNKKKLQLRNPSTVSFTLLLKETKVSLAVSLIYI